jgi:hypothetical protein
MIKVDIFEDKKDYPIGWITTENPITGSRVNDATIKELGIYAFDEKVPIINWILAAKLKIPGSPRLQTIWDFKDFEKKETEFILRGVIMRPEGLCIACAGTGKFQAKRHKATAKCPTCKGAGFTNEVWIDGESNDSGTVVGQSKDPSGASGS